MNHQGTYYYFESGDKSFRVRIIHNPGNKAQSLIIVDVRQSLDDISTTWQEISREYNQPTPNESGATNRAIIAQKKNNL